MNVTDPIADMLTRIRNALKAKHLVTQVPHSKMKLELARVLKEEGYVRNYKVAPAKPRDQIKLLLKYSGDGTSVITDLQRISKPGRRMYANKKTIPSIYGGLGVAILSTSKGLMTGHQAKEQGLGGELLCRVW